MKTIKGVLLLFVLLLVGLVSYGQQTGYTSLPYFCGFESPEDTVGTYGWKFEKRPKTNHSFVVGEAVHRLGSHAMYVSADGGNTAGYAFSGGSVVIAYKSFYLEKGVYDLMFEYRLQGEDLKDADVMRVAFYSGNKPATVATGEFPKYALDNAFVSRDGDEVFKTTLWRQVEGQVEAKEDGNYYLVFLFKEDGNKNIYNPGPCIDNIQFDRAKSLTACATKPINILIDKEATGIKLSWIGHASEYELMYNKVDNQKDTTVTIIKGITTTEYSIPYTSIPEGMYNFRIRALCDNDTSMWVEKANYMVYDDAKHCLNYMDFANDATKCYFGTFKNPKELQRAIDYGYESRHSIHTVHYMQDEYDRLTGYELKTVPEGEIASVRLGNWTEGLHGDSPTSNHGSPSGVIEYTYTIPEDKSVLLLKYAAVLQYASHHAPEEQTRITVEVLDQFGQRLECATAEFNAKDVSQGNTRGWKQYNPKEGEVVDTDLSPIMWLDWSTLGMNLEGSRGQTVKIRVTLNACIADYHFAYGYFVLDCTEGEVGGMSCTEKADTLFVPEGFNYLWYVQGDKNKTPITTERFFVPADDDINSYAVDLIYPEDNGCYFTLYANVWPRVPKVGMSYVHKPQDCVNYVELINSSKMVDLKMDKAGEVVDTIDVPSSTASIKDYYLEIKSQKGTTFENGLTITTDPAMRIVAPNEGDTFMVVVKGMFNTCEDVKEYKVEVPAIGETIGETHEYICLGGEVEFNGKTYSEAGVYIDTLKSEWCGCDSILKLTLETLVADTIYMDTTICSADMPFMWMLDFNTMFRLDTAGVYEEGVKSVLGCDSLYYVLNLEVLESLVMKIDEWPTEICEDDDLFEIGYEVLEGKVSGYSVRYSPKSQQAGFEDVDVEFEDNAENVVIDLPEGVRPDKYDGVMVFYNDECGNAEVGFSFDVLYSKDVIAQRWNDVLAVKNAEYNGGYEFVEYQWFLNGQPIEGAVSSQCYNGMDLDFGGVYKVLLKRKDDGVMAFTCGFEPEEYTEEQLNDIGVLVLANETIDIEVPLETRGRIYSISGLLYSVFDLDAGVNKVQMPSDAGLYLMVIEGESSVRKLVVRN